MIKVYRNLTLFDSTNKDFFPPFGDANSKIKSIWSTPPKQLVLVAEVDTNSLDKAYRLTNNIDGWWGDNPEVIIHATDVSIRRSTSIGDVLETEDGKCFVVNDIGFLEIPDRKLAEGSLEKLPLNMGIHPLIDELIEKRLKEER